MTDVLDLEFDVETKDSLHVPPPRRKGRIKCRSIEIVGRFDDHRRRRSFWSLPELDHKRLTTLGIAASGKHLSGSDTSGDRKFERVIVGIESVDAPQPWNNRTFAAVTALGPCATKTLNREEMLDSRAHIPASIGRLRTPRCECKSTGTKQTSTRTKESKDRYTTHLNQA